MRRWESEGLTRALPVVVVAFVALCGAGLWLTRVRPSASAERDPSPPTEPIARREPVEPAPRALAPITAATVADAGPAARAEAAPMPRRGPIMAPDATPLAGGAWTGAAKVGDTQPASTLDPEDVQRAIESVRPLILQCFEDAEDRFPPPQDVTLKFTLRAEGTSGRFGEGEIERSTIQDPWVQSCFLDALADARFAVRRNGGVATVTWPFHFEGKRPDGGGEP